MVDLTLGRVRVRGEGGGGLALPLVVLAGMDQKADSLVAKSSLAKNIFLDEQQWLS